MTSFVPYRRPVFLAPSIHWAVETGNLDEVHKVIAAEREKGYPASVCLAKKDELLSVSPLHVAAELGHVHIIQFLLAEGADINITDDTNTTALHLAAWSGHLDAVKLLVKRGALITKQDVYGDQPLHWAATKGHTEVVRALLDMGAAQEAGNREGWTALHRAAYNGRAATAELLLQRGASTSCLSVLGDTPLHLACRNNHLPLVQLLLEWKARPRLCNTAGELPYDVCVGDGARSMLLEADPSAAERPAARRIIMSAAPVATTAVEQAAERLQVIAESSKVSVGAGHRKSSSPRSAAASARTTSAQQPPAGLIMAHRVTASTPAPRNIAMDMPEAAPGSKVNVAPTEVSAIKNAMSALESYVAASQQQGGQLKEMDSTAPARWDVPGDADTSRPGTARTTLSQRTIRVSGAVRIDANGFPSELVDHS